MTDHPREFAGRWITAEPFCNLQPRNVYHRQLDRAAQPPPEPEFENRHILFRRGFDLQHTAGTVLYITADDCYKLYVNGQFVTQGPAPGYPFHYYYNQIDLTPYVRPGHNLIAVHTYYQGLINRVWVSGDRRHGLLLDLCQQDILVLASNESFLCREHSGYSAAGVVGYQTQFLERYDAAAPENGFESPGYDDSSWETAKIHQFPDYWLVPQPSKMLQFEEIRPLLLQQEEQRLFVDFGALYVGNLEFQATGRPGSEMVLRFAQELNDDGSLRWNLRAFCDYVEFFRLSGQKDTLKQFDYKAFRYASLELPPGVQVVPESIVLQARHYPFELKAHCNRSDPQSLAIWQLCVDTLHYGVQEVIQDCMEREKGYYLGDGCYSLLTYCLLTQDYSVMEKFFDDFLRTAFVNRGLMTCANCSFMQEIAEYPLIMCTMLLEYCYLVRDYDFVRKRFAAFADVLDFYREQYAEPDGLLNNLDKWCVVEWPASMRDGYDVDLTEGRPCLSKHNVINAYYLGAIKCLNKVAGMIGVKPYLAPEQTQNLQQTFVQAFYAPEQHLFRDSVSSDHVSLPGNVIAWWFELFPERAGVERLKQMIREKRLSQSLFFITFPMFCALSREGEDELMHALLTDENAWLKMLAQGATRTFEGWSKDLKRNASLFHLTLSYGAAFLTDWDIREIFRF